MRDGPAAKDLARAAIARLIDPDPSPWDPDTHPNLLLYVGSITSGLARTTGRKETRYVAVPCDSESDPRPLFGAPVESRAASRRTL